MGYAYVARGIYGTGTEGKVLANGVILNTAIPYELELGTATYTLTGSSVTITKDSALTLGAGTYTVTGTDVTLTADFALSLAAGTYTLTGTDVAVTWGTYIDLDPGSYTVTGTDVTLTFGANISPTPGVYTIVGADISYIYSGDPKVLVKASLGGDVHAASKLGSTSAYHASPLGGDVYFHATLH